LGKKLKVENPLRRAEPKQASTSRRQLSRWEKERRRRRIIEIVILVTIVAVLGLIGYGYYNTRIKPWHQLIVKVNDKVFDMSYYVKMLRLWGGDLSGEKLEEVVVMIERHELLRQAAKESDINISDDEVEQELRDLLSFDPDKESEEEFAQRYQDLLNTLRLSDKDFRQMFIEPMLLEEKLREQMGETFDQWLEQERTEGENNGWIISYLTPEKKTWALLHI